MMPLWKGLSLARWDKTAVMFMRHVQMPARVGAIRNSPILPSVYLLPECDFNSPHFSEVILLSFVSSARSSYWNSGPVYIQQTQTNKIRARTNCWAYLHLDAIFAFAFCISTNCCFSQTQIPTKVRPLSPFADAPSALHLITLLLEFAFTLRSPFSCQTAPITLRSYLNKDNMISCYLVYKKSWQYMILLVFCLILALCSSHTPLPPTLPSLGRLSACGTERELYEDNFDWED